MAELERVPARGKYDRKLTGEYRAARRRHALLRALATHIVHHGTTELSVAAITSLVRMGRNGFYENFEDVGAAARALEERAATMLSADLKRVHAERNTPIEHLKALVRECLNSMRDHEPMIRAGLLVGLGRPVLSDQLIRGVIASELEDVLDRLGSIGIGSSDGAPIRVNAATAIMVDALLSPATEASTPRLVRLVLSVLR